jgi:regulatory protein
MPDDFTKAIQYSCKLLNYRQRSEKELIERLKRKGFDAWAAGEAVRHLKDSGYLDDGALARTLRREAEDVKFLGLSGAKYYLMRMGISGGMADEALSGYDELAPARKLMDRKLRTLRGYPRAVARRRLYGLMRRRGYSSDTVRKTLKEAHV